MYNEKKAEITIDLDKLQKNGNELGQLIQKNSQELEEIAVADIWSFLSKDAANQDLHTEVYTVSLSNGAALDDFDAEFFSSAAVSIEGALEYGAGKIAFTDSFETVKITFSTEKAALTLILTNYVKPEKTLTYTFHGVDETASIAGVLSKNGIVSSYNNAVVSDETAVTVDGDTLTALSFFDEVTLTVTLEDESIVVVTLTNSEFIPANQTVQNEAGTFTAAVDLPAGAELKVTDAEVNESVVEQANAALGEEAQVLFYDISIVDADKNEIETGATVTLNLGIELDVPEGKMAKVTGYVYHVTEDGLAEQLDAKFTLNDNGIASVIFETKGFSVFGIAYTVDFVSTEGVSWSWPGVGSYKIADILAEIGVTGQIESVELKHTIDVGGAENALYLSDDHTEIISEVAFQDTFELKVVVDGITHVFTITDDAPEGSGTVGNITEFADIEIDVNEESTTTNVSRNGYVLFDINYTINNLEQARAHNSYVQTGVDTYRKQYDWEYDLTSVSSMLEIRDVVSTGTDLAIYKDGQKVGTFELSQGKLILHVWDPVGLSSNDDRAWGNVTVRVDFDENGVEDKESIDIQFPGVGTPVPVSFETYQYKQGTKNANQNSYTIYPDSYETLNGVGEVYYIDYTAAIRQNADMKGFTFTDTMDGNQTLVQSSVKVDGINYSENTTVNGNSFSVTLPDLVKNMDHTITYRTYVTKQQVEANGGYITINNTADWTKDDTTVPGGSASVTITKGTPNGGSKSVTPGGSVKLTDAQADAATYELTYDLYISEPYNATDLTLRDTFGDKQTFKYPLTITYTENNTEKTITIDAANNNLTVNNGAFALNLDDILSANGSTFTKNTLYHISYKTDVPKSEYGNDIINNAKWDVDGTTDLPGGDTSVSLVVPGTNPGTKTATSVQQVTASGSTSLTKNTDGVYEATDESDGTYYLITWQLEISQPDANSVENLVLTDTYGQDQEFLKNTVSIWRENSGGKYTVGTPANEHNTNGGNYWQFSAEEINVYQGYFSLDLAHIVNNTFIYYGGKDPYKKDAKYFVSYQTKVPASKLASVTEFPNNAEWSVDGKPAPGGDDKVEITHKDFNSGNKTWTINGGRDTEIDGAVDTVKIDYEVTIKEDLNAASAILTDTLGGIQQLDTASIVIKGDDGTNLPVNVSASDIGYSYNADTGVWTLDVAKVLENNGKHFTAGVTYTVAYSATVDMTGSSATTISDLTNTANWTFTGEDGHTGSGSGGNDGPEELTPTQFMPGSKRMTGVDNASRRGNNYVVNFDAPYTLNYSLTINEPRTPKTSAVLTDVYSANETFVPASIKVQVGRNVFDASEYTTDSPSAHTFTLDLLGLLAANNMEFQTDKNYIITYTTTSSVIYDSENDENTKIVNTATWKFDGDDQPGGTTTTKIIRGITLEKSYAGKGESSTSIQPGDTVTYTIKIGTPDEDVGNYQITDQMLALQVINSDIKIYQGSIDETKLYTTIAQNTLEWDATGHAYTNSTEAENMNRFSYKFPENAGNGPFFMVFDVHVISAEEALSAKIYDTQTVTNKVTGSDGSSDDTEFDITLGSHSTIDKAFDHFDPQTKKGYWVITVTPAANTSLMNYNVTESNDGAGSRYSTVSYEDVENSNNWAYGFEVVSASTPTKTLASGTDYVATETTVTFKSDIREKVTMILSASYGYTYGANIFMSNTVHLRDENSNYVDEGTAEGEYIERTLPVDKTLRSQTDLPMSTEREGASVTVYRFQVDINKDRLPINNGVLHFVDVLPEGMVLIDIGTEYYDPQTYYVNPQTGVHETPRIKVDNEYIQPTINGQAFSCDIENPLNGNPVTVTYAAVFTEEELAERDKTGILHQYTNTVEVSDSSSERVGTDDYTIEYQYKEALKKEDLDKNTEEVAAIRYKVTVNQYGQDLNSTGDTLVLTDTLSTSVEFNKNTVKVVSMGTENDFIAYNLNYDGDSRTMTFTLPDATPIDIYFEVEPLREGSADYKNEVLLIGDGTFYDSTEARHTRTSGSGGISTESEGRIFLEKISSDSPTTALQGVKFELYRLNYNATTYKIEGDPIKVMEATTDAQGKVTFYPDDGDGRQHQGLQPGILYYWVETDISELKEVVNSVATPSDQYTIGNNGNPHYFVFFSGANNESDPYYQAAKALDSALQDANGIVVNTSQKGYNWPVTNKKNKDFTVTKVWSGDTEATRPKLVQVQLYRDGESMGPDYVASVQVNAAGDWTYSWKNLPAKNPETNEEYTYTALEIVPEGYAASYQSVGSDSVTITNTKLNEGEIEVSKIWNDSFNKLFKRPTEITYILYKTVDGLETEFERKTVTANDNWKHTWTNLETGDGISYRVAEVEISDYSTTYLPENATVESKGSVVITNTLDSTSLTVNKRWNMADGSSPAWPDEHIEVTVKLMKQQGENLVDVSTPAYYSEGGEGAAEGESWSATQTLTNSQRSYTWEHIDPLNENEAYVVKETAVVYNDNGTTKDITTVYPLQTSDSATSGNVFLTNHQTSASLIVRKMLEGNATDTTEVFNFIVALTNQTDLSGTYGEMTFDNGRATFTLNGGQSKTAAGLPAGTTYTVVESEANQNGYTTTVTPAEGETHEENSLEAQGTLADGETDTVVFTNTKETYGEIELKKTVSGEGADHDQEFTFTVTILNEDGTETDETFSGEYGDVTFTDGVATLTLKHDQTKKIADLPNGTRYKIEETAETGYAVNKITVDEEEQTVNGTVIYSGTINCGVGETEGTNAKVAVAVENKKTETVNVNASKAWAAGTTAEQMPTAIQFTLLRKDPTDPSNTDAPTPVDGSARVITKPESGNWPTAVWTDLPKYVDNTADEPVAYQYTVEETGVYFGALTEDEGGHVPSDAVFVAPSMYTVTGGDVTFTDNIGAATITNTPITVNVPVDKSWGSTIDQDDNYTWTITLRFEESKEHVSGPVYEGANTVDDGTDGWAVVPGYEEVVISKDSTDAEKTIENLPMYHVYPNGGMYRHIYSATETAYELKHNGETVSKWDNVNGLTVGADQYVPNYWHDAGDKNDTSGIGENDADFYHLKISNSVAGHLDITDKITNLSLKKTWEEGAFSAAGVSEDDAYAKFELRRYIAKEYREYIAPDPATTYTVTVYDENDVKQDEIAVIKGSRIRLVVTASSSYSGEVPFKKGVNGEKNIVINVSQGSTASYLFTVDQDIDIFPYQDQYYNIWTQHNPVSEMHLSTTSGASDDPAPDTVWNNNAPVYTLQKGHWTETIPELPLREISEIDETTGQQTIYIYSYYFAEVDSNPKGYYVTQTDDDGNPIGYADSRINTSNVTVNALNKPTPPFVVKKVWRGVPENGTDDFPPINFSLYQAELNNDNYTSSSAWIYTDENGTRYENIELGPDNDWTWICPVNLPTQLKNGTDVKYYVVENPSKGELSDKSKWEVYGYSGEKDAQGQYTRIALGNQPHNAAIREDRDNEIKGTIIIHNTLNNYLQMDVKKKYIDYSQNVWETDTSIVVSNTVLGFKVIRKTYRQDTGAMLKDWEDYGSEMLVGYGPGTGYTVTDDSGHTYQTGQHIESNEGNGFYLFHAGLWHWTILDQGGDLNNEHLGLPKYGMYTDPITHETIPTVYAYSIRETGVYANLNRDPWKDTSGNEWEWWSTNTPPHAESGDESIVPEEVFYPQADFPVSDSDRVNNYKASDLKIEKKWLGNASNAVREVYVKVYRKAGENGELEDFTDIIAADVAGNNWQGYMHPGEIDTTNKWIILTNKDGWSADIKVHKALIAGLNNAGEYSYYIKEVGYKDSQGNVHQVTDGTFDPIGVGKFDPRYEKISGGNWEGTTSVTPTDKQMTIGAVGQNGLRVWNAPTMNLSVEKKWYKEDGTTELEQADVQDKKVSVKIKQYYKKQPATDEVDWTNAQSRILIFKANASDTGTQTITFGKDGANYNVQIVSGTHDTYLYTASGTGATDWKLFLDGLQKMYIDDDGTAYCCKYEIAEANAPGFTTVYENNGVTQSGQTVTVKNTESDGMTIHVTKQWMQNNVDKTSAALTAAFGNDPVQIPFTLYQVLTDPTTNTVKEAGKVYTTYGANHDGVGYVTYDSATGWATVDIPDLPLKDSVIDATTGQNVECKATYYVVEGSSVHADPGYVLSVTYQNSTQGSASGTPSDTAVGDDGTITIINTETAGVTLPSTGGPGTVLYTAAGLSLILGASLWLMFRRRKEQQN